jgi:hypothetical protein
MQKFSTNQQLAATVAALAAVLLVGHAIGFGWAGGEGIEADVPASIIGESYAGTVTIEHAGARRSAAPSDAIVRGEIVRTGDDGRVMIQIGADHVLALDNRTDVRIDDLRPSTMKITLIQGRVYLSAQRSTNEKSLLISSTKGTDVSIPYGRASVVNYNFKNVFAVYPIDTFAAIVLPDDSATVTKTGIEISEVEPVSVADVDFDAASSAAADFYRWAGLIQ